MKYLLLLLLAPRAHAVVPGIVALDGGPQLQSLVITPVTSSFTFINTGTALAANGGTDCQATIVLNVSTQAPVEVIVSGSELLTGSQSGWVCDVRIDGTASGRTKSWNFNTSGLNFTNYIVPLVAVWHFKAGIIAGGSRSICLNCYDPGSASGQGAYSGTTEFWAKVVH